MKLIVDPVQRHAKMRAHTAIHLIHAELTKVFPYTKQAGSLVDQDYCRFDFYADRNLTQHELEDIQNAVNTYIMQALPVIVHHMPYQQALALGAKAFFQEKYPEMVRVVCIGTDPTADTPQTTHLSCISMELCGGTHVSNTAHIGACIVVHQESVAAGIKRIVAYTGPQVARSRLQLHQMQQQIAQQLGVQTAHISNKITTTLDQIQQATKRIQLLEQTLVAIILPSIQEVCAGYRLIRIDIHPELQTISMQTLIHVAKQKNIECIIICADGTYAIVGKNAKQFAQHHGLKGGGSETCVQGKDPKILDLCV